MTSGLSADYCIFEYRYRDASNWKTYGELLLTGNFSEQAESEIRRVLGDDGMLVAEQVGIPPLQQRHLVTHRETDEDLDHAFHEFVSLQPATKAHLSQLQLDGSLSDLTERLRASATNWNVALSPYAQRGKWLKR